jgi:hypothetical protein
MSVLTASNPRWLTIGRAARYLGCSPLTVRRLISRGRLSVRRIPYAWPQVAQEELDLLEASVTTPATEPAEGSAA